MPLRSGTLWTSTHLWEDSSAHGVWRERYEPRRNYRVTTQSGDGPEWSYGWEITASQWMRFLLDFSYATGLRASELVNATLGNIRVDEHSDQRLHVVGKGSRPGKGALPPLARTALEAFNEDRRWIFVEPPVRMPDGKVIRPDIVICNRREAICFLELKYVPRGKAGAKKNIQSITSIAPGDDIAISLERYRGRPTRECRLKSPSRCYLLGVAFTPVVRSLQTLGARNQHSRISSFLKCTQQPELETTHTNATTLTRCASGRKDK
jgi:hypothetical protein